MSRERAAIMMEQQALACARMGSPLYAALLTRTAQDIRAGGPGAAVVAGYEDRPSTDAIALRLMGAVHSLVLSARAPELAAVYPSVGGVVDPDRPGACWPTFRDTLETHRSWIRAWMRRPPQTNEVGRANQLIIGLLAAVAHCPLPVRLFELGCSAGLNLRADRFRCVADDLAWGPAGSPVVLRPCWQGPPPRWLSTTTLDHPFIPIVERRGCDLLPIDPLSRHGMLVLRSYIWADQITRSQRLDAALAVAAQVPVQVEATGAAEFIQRIRTEPGTLTVVWHSVLRQFMSTADRARVDTELRRLAADAAASKTSPASGRRAGFAHICFEPGPSGWQHDFRLSVSLDGSPIEVLAEADAHGLPARPPGHHLITTGSMLRHR